MRGDNVHDINERTHQVRPQSGYGGRPNEIRIMEALFKSGATMTIRTTVSEDPVVGKLDWFDINNIALVVKGNVVVCPKYQIETWSYRCNDAANA